MSDFDDWGLADESASGGTVMSGDRLSGLWQVGDRLQDRQPVVGQQQVHFLGAHSVSQQAAGRGDQEVGRSGTQQALYGRNRFRGVHGIRLSAGGVHAIAVGLR
ncbi:hypothetical protein ACGF8D_26310 [Streptomyces massasporeus]|uniref:hypothetical protein n=1 Tax=Streptomyces massasporeus TaxID=67324 RepID=UPI003711F96F